jgi:hypothetical protein
MLLPALLLGLLGLVLVWVTCRQSEFRPFALLLGLSIGAPAGVLVGAVIGLLLMARGWPGPWPFGRRGDDDP